MIVLKEIKFIKISKNSRIFKNHKESFLNLIESKYGIPFVYKNISNKLFHKFYILQIILCLGFCFIKYHSDLLKKIKKYHFTYFCFFNFISNLDEKFKIKKNIELKKFILKKNKKLKYKILFKKLNLFFNCVLIKKNIKKIFKSQGYMTNKFNIINCCSLIKNMKILITKIDRMINFTSKKLVLLFKILKHVILTNEKKSNSMTTFLFTMISTKNIIYICRILVAFYDIKLKIIQNNKKLIFSIKTIWMINVYALHFSSECQKINLKKILPEKIYFNDFIILFCLKFLKLRKYNLNKLFKKTNNFTLKKLVKLYYTFTLLRNVKYC
ncbi:hypothetical protein [Guillardia theta]|uniref:Uncharacterized protein n=1 Tax=Guillardia theta TaxID=55529 RepID=Q9AVY6_GUITH|nr:hypothetical protein GTHECHR2176 [Guillardia theta]CAC27085.1 hypothetical protein [Guillardia theta]|mmetsp:Transcript_34558/g.108337  ORF Transcript_34558/g.108337 Transcript_34558/m.108337 type:complete len:326 (-) Transcript_34558:826-1803(-)